MTDVIDPRGVSADQVDQNHGRWLTALAALIIGAVLGAVVGAVLAAASTASYTASTALSVLPDPAISITAQNGGSNTVPSQDATTFIQGQLVVFNGPEVAAQVRQGASLNTNPDVTATQVGQTYVVRVSAVADSPARAQRIAALAGQAYSRLRTTQLTQEIVALRASTNRQLGTVSAALNAARSNSSGSALTPSQTALQTEYERLLSVRSSLDATASQVGGIVTVVSPPSQSNAGLSAGTRDTAAGAIVGAVLALVVLILARRLRPRIRGAADLIALDVPLLLPVLPRPSLRAPERLGGGSIPISAEARLLAARLDAEPLRELRPLILLGANASAGTSQVAASVAAALATRAPVLLVGSSVTSPITRAGAPSNPAVTIPPAARRSAPEPAEQRPVDPSIHTLAPDASDGSAPAGRDVELPPTTSLSHQLEASAKTLREVGRVLLARRADRRHVEPEEADSWGTVSIFADDSATDTDRGNAARQDAAREGAGHSDAGRGDAAREDAGHGDAGRDVAEADVLGDAGVGRHSWELESPVDRAEVVPSSARGVWLPVLPANSGSPVGPAGGAVAAQSVLDLARLVRRAHQAGWLVVVDAEPVSTSDAALDCARDGAVAALVVGRGRTTPAEVLAAVELFEADDIPLLGTILNTVSPWPSPTAVDPVLKPVPGAEPTALDAVPWTVTRQPRHPGRRPHPSSNGAKCVDHSDRFADLVGH